MLPSQNEVLARNQATGIIQLQEHYFGNKSVMVVAIPFKPNVAAIASRVVAVYEDSSWIKFHMLEGLLNAKCRHDKMIFFSL